MGQEQSVAAAAAVENSSRSTTSTLTENSSRPSLDSLIAEAAAYGDEDADQSLEAKARKALECPCISDLRSGPCGAQFSDAFICFLKSTSEEKGSDCVHPFVALQNCIKENPNAFSKDILEDYDSKEVEKPIQQYVVRPPLWSVESKPSKRTP